MKAIPCNLYRCGLTPPPKLHKLPFNLTWDEYNYGMSVQVILTYVECGENCLGKIFQRNTLPNDTTAVVTATATWYSDIPL